MDSLTDKSLSANLETEQRTHTKDSEVVNDVSANGINSFNVEHSCPITSSGHSSVSQPPLHKQAAYLQRDPGRIEDESGKLDLAAGFTQAPLQDLTHNLPQEQLNIHSDRPTRNVGAISGAVHDLGPGRIAALLEAYDELNSFIAQVTSWPNGPIAPLEATGLIKRLMKLSRALDERLRALRYVGLADQFEAQCSSIRAICEGLYNDLSNQPTTAPFRSLADYKIDHETSSTEGAMLTTPVFLSTLDVKYSRPVEHLRHSASASGGARLEASKLKDDLDHDRDENLKPQNVEELKIESDKDFVNLLRYGKSHVTRFQHRQVASASSSRTSSGSKASSDSSLSSRSKLKKAEAVALKAKRQAMTKVHEIRQRELNLKNEISQRELSIKTELECAELDAEIATTEAHAKALNELCDKGEIDSRLSSLSKVDRVSDLFLQRNDDDGTTKPAPPPPVSVPVPLNTSGGPSQYNITVPPPIKSSASATLNISGGFSQHILAAPPPVSVPVPLNTSGGPSQYNFAVPPPIMSSVPAPFNASGGFSQHNLAAPLPVSVPAPFNASGGLPQHNLAVPPPVSMPEHLNTSGGPSQYNFAVPPPIMSSVPAPFNASGGLPQHNLAVPPPVSMPEHLTTSSGPSQCNIAMPSSFMSSLVASGPVNVTAADSPPIVISAVDPPNKSSGSSLNVHCPVFEPRYISQTYTTPQCIQPHISMSALGSTGPLISGYPYVCPQTETTLARSIADAMSISRLPVPKPSVFSGDPLEYPAWSVSFQHLVRNDAVAPEDKMLILRDYISGPAKEAVGDLYYNLSEASYKSALEILRRRFGEDYTVSQAMKTKLEAWPDVKFKDSSGLRRYADYLRQCLVMSQTISGLGVLNDPAHIKTLSHKLPDGLALSWGKRVAESKAKSGMYPSLEAFVNFLECQADALFEADLQTKTKKPTHEDKSSNKMKAGQSFSVDTHEGSSDTSSQQPGETDIRGQPLRVKRCSFCDKNHYIQDCEQFAREAFDDRRSFALRKRLCFKCLRPGHSARGCVVKVQCKKCNAKHVTVMHDPNFRPPSKEENPTKVTDGGQMKGEEKKAFLTARQAETQLFSLYMPVYISSGSNPSKEELVYAMLDTMSDTSFLIDSAMDVIELETQESVLTLTTLTSARSTISCRTSSNLCVRAIDSNEVIHIPRVYSQSDIEVNRDQIPTNKVVDAIPHLRHLSPHFSPLIDAPVALLIGTNASEALKPLEVVSGEPGQPYAMRTKLGWSLVGEVHAVMPTENQDAEPEGCFNISCGKMPAMDNVSMCFRTKDHTNDRLIELIERDFACPNEDPASQDDYKFLSILSDGIRMNNQGHYEMPLPFRNGNPRLPNNRHLALRRLYGLKQKFLKCPEHFSLYKEFVGQMLSRHDAEQVPQEEINADSVWYIPHHGVYNPNKPGKIRVVFDCAARCQNVSLNDCLLTGPDLMNSLVGVLCRFRLGPVAISCDVERMFHQFSVAPGHRDYLRFLWWPNDDLNASPVDFRMCVHLFGAASSPGCANYGLKTLAKDHQTVSAEASAFIQEDFYVDDGLCSKDSDEEAIELLKGARAICQKGNLHLHKIASNSQKVLSAFPEDDVVKFDAPADLDEKSEVSIERALGVRWNLLTDALHFQHVVKETPSTKRGVLSVVASVFDPLGLIAPVVLKGRQILQELCKLKIDWDDNLTPGLSSRLNDWILDMRSLSDIQIPRCYFSAASHTWNTIELHHFADASTKGYGECSYIRMVDHEGHAHSSLVMAKSKVAPLKAVTVPRLELQAAVLAVKIAKFLEREFGQLHVVHHFWTDSRVVLGYIYNETKRFHVFVSNRLRQIRDFSLPQQWHYIDTNQNPADHASRGLCVEDMKASNWQSGPDFLRQDEICYKPVNATVEDDDKEVKAFATTRCDEPGDVEEILKRFSSLRRLLRVVWLIKTWRQMAKKRRTRQSTRPAFTPEVRKQILDSLIRAVQRQHFPDSSQTTNSQLRPLNAFTDDEGLLRVGGRLSESVEDFQIRHPLILPRSSSLSRLMARHYHEKVQHSGRTFTIGALQTNGFWICGARSIVDSIIHHCVPCTKQRGKPMEQRMAELPPDRTEAAPPFTNTGLDCFGPFIVKEGRRDVKRYGLILTCLASRAVHLEVIEDMSTDAFICGLRRFIALRGNVKLIRCDRGTNFVGAERELREARKEMNDIKIVEELSERNCKFLFNPPSASHFGGVWERMIRIVRQILQDLIAGYSGRLTSDALATLFHEVASIVNNRPLCPANLHDPSSCVPLTPNHLLTLRPEPVFPPPGNFQRDDVYARKRWRRVQFLASQFWARWRQEYLPTLQPRKKWFLKKDSVKTGMLVLMVDEAAPRGIWRTARVEKVYPGSDGLARSVQLRVCCAEKDESGRLIVRASFMDRPIHKLVPLNIKTD